MWFPLLREAPNTLITHSPPPHTHTPEAGLSPQTEPKKMSTSRIH